MPGRPSSTPRMADHLSFTPSHALLNPKFESYKLSPASPDSALAYALPQPFSTPALPEHARLSYNEVSARARHNHLAAERGGECVWVDGKGEVWAVEVDKQSAQPSFHRLAQLPLPTSAPSSSSTIPEYPTAISLSSSLWAISTGLGTLHLLTLSRPSFAASLSPAFELRDEQTGDLVPFRLHATDALSDAEALVLLSRVVKNAPSSSAPDPADSSATPSSAHAKTRLKIPSSTAFEYLSARISLAPASAEEGQEPEPLTPLWRLRGADLPAYVHFDREGARYVVGATGPLSALAVPPRASAANAATASLDAAEAEADAAMRDDAADAGAAEGAGTGTGPAPRPPPFSWMQDKESLTVAFPVPSDTPTSSIRITFSRQYVTLHVGSATSAAAAASPAAGAKAATLPRLSHKRFWAEIDPHTSVWTFDREAEGRDSTFGLLTLHLEKQHAGTRWTDVFASSASPASEGASGRAKIEELDPELEYEGVPETMDPSELASIAEKMEQWAQSLVSGPDGMAEGLGHGVPTSLMGDEMDVEVDADSGRPVVLSFIEDAATAQPRLVTPHATIPYALLSTPIPSASSAAAAQDEAAAGSVTIKHDVDGLLFSPPPASSAAYTWTHTATFPALAFVLATKRDTRFVYHLLPPLPSSSESAGAVLAFDAPALLPAPSPSAPSRGGGNLFVYFAPPAGSKSATGKQMVVRVGGAGSGALVGAAAVELEGGERAVLALCEREVVVVRVFA
ncbi:hypothetical protein JCM10207_006405 [Rhodosporidiobolus poonsookiae]